MQAVCRFPWQISQGKRLLPCIPWYSDRGRCRVSVAEATAKVAQIQAQLSGWYTKFNDRLASAYDPDLNRTVYRNLGRVNKWGIDASLAYSAAKELTIYAFGSWNKSKIQDDVLNGECNSAQVTAGTFGCTTVGIRPEHLEIVGNSGGQWTGNVIHTEKLGADSFLYLDVGGDEPVERAQALEVLAGVMDGLVQALRAVFEGHDRLGELFGGQVGQRDRIHYQVLRSAAGSLSGG